MQIFVYIIKFKIIIWYLLFLYNTLTLLLLVVAVELFSPQIGFCMVRDRAQACDVHLSGLYWALRGFYMTGRNGALSF